MCAAAGDPCGGDFDTPGGCGCGDYCGHVRGVAFADRLDGVCQVFGDFASGQVNGWPCAGYLVRRVDDRGCAVRGCGGGVFCCWFDQATGQHRFVGAGVERRHSE